MARKNHISSLIILVLSFWTCEATILSLSKSSQTINSTKSTNICKNCVCGLGRQARIVNGNITSFEEFPWAVQIKLNDKIHCGGSMITQRHILTAAHCIHKFRRWWLTVHLADTYRYKIKSMKVHEKYDERIKIHDIGIIELYLPVSLDIAVRTVCLPNSPTSNYTGMTGVAIGWGKTGEEKLNIEQLEEPLRKVALPIMSKEECLKSKYPKSRITDSIFCAGYMEGGRDSCGGDSGGPLLVRNDAGAMEIAGIVSLGYRNCAEANYPGIYTKVTDYLEWIYTHIDNECVCTSVSN